MNGHLPKGRRRDALVLYPDATEEPGSNVGGAVTQSARS